MTWEIIKIMYMVILGCLTLMALAFTVWYILDLFQGPDD